MTQFVVLAQAPIGPGQFFQPASQRGAQGPGEAIYINTGLTRVVVRGTGFTYDAGGVPIGGTISSIDLFDAGGTTRLAGFSDVALGLESFDLTWTGGTFGAFPAPGWAVFAALLDGDDLVEGAAGDDLLVGFAGEDRIVGGAGQDRVTYAQDDALAGAAGVAVDLASGTARDGFGDFDTLTGIEEVEGTRYDDELVGGSVPLPDGRAYGLFGLDGDDRLEFDYRTLGFAAPGAGDDVVVSLLLEHATFGDTTGQAGPFGRLMTEVSYAEAQGDVAAVFDFATGWIHDPYGGRDALAGLIGGARMTVGDDTFLGASHSERIAGLAGDDTIHGNDGYDTVRYDLDAAYGGSAGVVVFLEGGFAHDGFGDTDTISSIEHAIGTNHPGTEIAGASDVLIGNGVFNILTGLGGADFLDGRDWYDMADYARDAEHGGTAAVYVNLADSFGRDGWGNYDVLLNMEHVRGTNAGMHAPLEQGDVLVGGAGHNMFQGLAGNDIIDGGAGIDDTVSYEADAAFGGGGGVFVDLGAGMAVDGFGDGDVLVGIEWVIGTNNDQPGSPGIGDILLGSDAANQLEGLLGNDVLDGRGGDDRLVSGDGFDIMTGGEGADLFFFDQAQATVDLITDFVPGVDKIGIDVGLGYGFQLAFMAVDGGIAAINQVSGATLVVLGAGSEQDILAALTTSA